MKEEQKNILKQKGAEEKKAILITIVVVLVIALLILAAVLFLPNEGEDTPDKFSTDQTDNTLSNVAYNSEDDVLGDISSVTDESGSDISKDNSNSGSEELVHRWVQNNLGITYVYGDTGLEQFNATATTIERYADAINELAATLPSSIKVYSMLAPTNVEFVEIPRAIYSSDDFFNSSQKSTIIGINEKLSSRITSVNIYDTLAAHTDEYLYFRTDINWTSLAAYYAYCDFAAAAGFTPINLSDYGKDSYTNYLGRFYWATKDETPALSANPDTIDYYFTDKNDACKLTIRHKGVTYSNYSIVGNSVSSTANGYNVFLGREAEYYKITTGASGGKKLVIVSDTSAAAFVPYLVCHYSEIHYINPNYCDYKLSEFAIQNNADEVLFLSYATSANRKAYTTVLSSLKGISE